MLSTVAKLITFGFHFLKLLSGFWNFLINIFKVCEVCLVDHTCNPNTQGPEAGGWHVQSQPELYRERQALSQTNTNKNRTLPLKVSKLVFVQ